MAETPLHRLLSSGDARRIHSADVDAFLAAPLGALLITGDPTQRPEAEDLAVIGRELKKLSGGQLSLGLVDFADEDEIKARLQVNVVPTVVFVKAGKVVASVPRLQDWAVYARAAATLFPKAEVL